MSLLNPGCFYSGEVLVLKMQRGVVSIQDLYLYRLAQLAPSQERLLESGVVN
jgi:hypothetical protein